MKKVIFALVTALLAMQVPADAQTNLKVTFQAPSGKTCIGVGSSVDAARTRAMKSRKCGLATRSQLVELKRENCHTRMIAQDKATGMKFSVCR